jgi:hypothetical protein
MFVCKDTETARTALRTGSPRTGWCIVVARRLVCGFEQRVSALALALLWRVLSVFLLFPPPLFP